jgi:hypothetical protein
LLPLFTHDIAGKAIADLIISFSECLASARAPTLLLIWAIIPDLTFFLVHAKVSPIEGDKTP